MSTARTIALGWLAASAVCGLVTETLNAAANTRARLVLSAEEARPGERVWAGVVLTMSPGWHTYWRNGGDSGGPTTIEWQLPAGVTAGPISWPAPEKNVVAGFTTYVFSGEVVLLVPLDLATNLPTGTVTIGAKVAWLECSDMCLPGQARVQASLQVGSADRPSPASALVESALAGLPRPGAVLDATARWSGAVSNDLQNLVLSFKPEGTNGVWDFFPYESDFAEVAGPTVTLPSESGRVRLEKGVKRVGAGWPEVIEGLVVRQASAGGTVLAAYEVALRPAVPGAEKPVAAAAAGGPSLPWMLLFAFVGGLILNIMPCVLPVIALKILGFVNQSGESPARVRQLGLVYGAGVLVSFLGLAGLAIGVKAAGGMASWGMVLQNQVFRVLLTVVVVLVSLNLFGLFEIALSGRVMGPAGELAGREGMAGAFFNGVLATILATPCTAPFLSVALAFAFTQPAVVIVLFFLATGLGLAVPFVALCWQPGWRRFMPKPGAWMERFKVAMGFPMLATAVWLFWFTAPRYGKSGVLWLGLFLVVLAAAAWTWGEFVQRGRHGRGWAAGVALALVAAGYGLFLEHQLHWREAVTAPGSGMPLAAKPGSIDWQPWSPEALAAARAQGRPVLVDFTADNCLNCQVNKATSLEISATVTKLKEIGAVALLGDFTDSDPRIAAELKRHQRAGVPLVLVYPKDPGSEPIVLPTILTPSLVLEALEKAAR